MHLDPHDYASGYEGMQAWVGMRLQDTPGQERDALIFATNESHSAGSYPTERLAIEYTGNVVPGDDGQKNFGSSSKRWNALFASTSAIQTSDKQDKKNIEENKLGLDFINALKTRSYKFIQNESNRTHYGLVAQEIESILPDFGISLDDYAPISKEKIEVDGKERYRYGLRYAELQAPLIKAIQELSTKVTALENA